MRSLWSLRVRVPLLATGILAASLGVAAFLAYELLLLAGRDSLENAIERERNRFVGAITPLLQSDADDDALRAGILDYLEHNPGTDSYVKVVRMGDDLLLPEGGPSQLAGLVATGTLPASMPGDLTTIDTPVGEILSLTDDLDPQRPERGTVQVAAPLEPIRSQSLLALRRLLIAATVTLVLGGGLLAIVLGRQLRPLRALARAARSTELRDLSARVPEPSRLDEVGEMAREFNQMLTRLEQGERDRQEFLATVSHELRTPITIARGHLEVLAKSRVPPQRDRVAESSSVVLRELSHMTRLVDDLMALAHSTAPDFVVRTPLLLPAFFDDLRLRIAGLELDEVEIDDPPPLAISADPDRLAQAVLNLVVNAAVHTPPGTRIEIAACVVGESIDLSIHDDGPGFDPSVRDRAFEPFVHGPSGDGHSSTGLGLTVVALVVSAHGGDVRVDTGRGGTTVTIQLPLGEVPGLAPVGATPRHS